MRGETVHVVHTGDCGQREGKPTFLTLTRSQSVLLLSAHFPNSWALHLPRKRAARDIQSFPNALQILVKTVRSLAELIHQHNPNQTPPLNVMPGPLVKNTCPLPSQQCRVLGSWCLHTGLAAALMQFPLATSSHNFPPWHTWIYTLRSKCLTDRTSQHLPTQDRTLPYSNTQFEKCWLPLKTL